MTKANKGTLYIISGPSGVGKGTLKQRLLSEFGEHLKFSVSATTRSPRPGEQEGVDYFYMDESAFRKRIEENNFLEYARYAGNFYGTPYSFVEGLLQEGKDVILEIDLKGARQVMERKPDCISVFILPPSMQELESRLRGRGTEDEEKIRRRLAAADEEIAHADEYTYQLVNDNLDETYEELKKIYLKHAGFCN